MRWAKGDVDEYFTRPRDVRGNFTDDKANVWGEGGPHNHPEEETGDYKVAQWLSANGESWRQASDDDGGFLSSASSLQCTESLLREISVRIHSASRGSGG